MQFTTFMLLSCLRYAEQSVAGLQRQLLRFDTLVTRGRKVTFDQLTWCKVTDS